MDIIGQLRKKFPSLKQGPNGEYLANCPMCLSRVGKEDTGHKLYINPNKYSSKLKKRGSWFCQRCNYRGWGLDLLGVFAVEESNKRVELLSIGDKLRTAITTNANFEFPESYSTEFSNSKLGEQAYDYLTRARRIDPAKIVYYRLGYCSYGRYKGCVILPVFDQGNLVYFVARSIFGKRYLNPPLPNRTILFNYRPNAKRIIITEGIFDAIAAGYDGVALLGKYLKDGQKELISLAQPKEVYVLLDDDAKQNAVSLARSLKTVVPNVKLVGTGKYHDAGEMPAEAIEEAINNAYPVTLSGIMSYLNEKA